MLQILHEDPKESYQLVENGHPMTSLRCVFFLAWCVLSAAIWALVQYWLSFQKRCF